MSEVINSNSESENIRNSEFDFGYLERATNIAKKIILSSINHENELMHLIKKEINDVLSDGLEVDGIIIEDAENARSLTIMNLKSLIYSEIDGDYTLPTSRLMKSMDNWHL